MTPPRRYSASEVLAMRKAISQQHARFDTMGKSGIHEWKEDELRTYILAGVEPDDLIVALAAEARKP